MDKRLVRLNNRRCSASNGCSLRPTVNRIFPALRKSAIAALCFLTGCSHSPYDLAPVDGSVTIDGRPVTEAKVMFAPIAQGGDCNAGKPAFGWLGGDGCFELTTYDENDGAIVGEHWVTIIRGGADDSPSVGSPPSGGSLGHRPTFDRMAVPRKFSVVAGQQNHVEIKLSAADVARFGRRED